MRQNTIFVTPNELFCSLENISTSWSVETRYNALRRVLTTAIEQQLADVTIKLSGPYAKLDYLIKLHKVRENDRSLSFAINALRKRFEKQDVTHSSELNLWWETDLKAVAQFVSLTYNAPVPNQLAQLWKGKPTNTFGTPSKAPKKDDYIKCIVTDFDDKLIYATREDNDQAVSIDYTAPNQYVPGDWSYLKRLLHKGMMLNVIRPRKVSGDNLLPELIIVLPDYLVNVTSIASCFDEVGHSPFANLLSMLSPSASTKPMLLGNFAGQLLDEETFHHERTYAQSIKTFFKNNALSIATCAEIDNNFHTEAKQQKANIHQMLNNDFKEQTSAQFRSEQIILEPSFFSDMMGMQGRMDFLNLNYRIVIEQKSGKCQWRPGAKDHEYTGKKESHYVQLLLYRALLHYDYKQLSSDDMQSFLLYSRYAHGLDMATSAPTLLFDAIKLRNQLAWCQQWYAQGGARVLETLTPEQIYPKAHGPLWQRFKRPQIMDVLGPIQSASALEKAYYARFMQFIANEQALSKIGNRTKENAGFAATWNSSIEEKREAGNIFENMELDASSLTSDEVKEACFTLKAKVPDHPADLSNFRQGDIAFFYPYAQGTLPDATSIMVFRCSIVEITANRVKVRLRNTQTSRKIFEYFSDKVWAMEHDFLDSSYNAQYRGLQAFLSAPMARRNLLLGQQKPRIDHTQKRIGEYGNEEFNTLVEHAMQARDLYLIIGPPGTGKTSYGMKNLLTEELKYEGSNVLLLSYTNRAVDEICSKLIEIEGLDFVRIGSDYSCEPTYRPYLLSERIEQMEQPSKQRMLNLIERTRVFCGTTTALSASISLLSIKHFSLAIVDEASQILEPHLLGLLSATTPQGESAIERVALIGDEKQLPAVVQQSEKESEVNNPMLNAIGLSNCRLSLFERLLHLYAYLPDGNINEEVCHMLTRQGRMHHDIASFPSQYFYEGKLREVPLPHQVEATQMTPNELSDMERAVVSCRVSFLHCTANLNPEEPDKVNSIEAQLIAQLAEHIYKHTSHNFSALKTIGIIVPYRNQIATVRTAISHLNIEALNNITIDTVERYQGSQRDYIIYGFTAKRKYQLAFLTNHEYRDERTGSIIDRKLNVAMTRARKHLLLVGNAQLLSNDFTFRRLIEYVKSNNNFFCIHNNRIQNKHND